MTKLLIRIAYGYQKKDLLVWVLIIWFKNLTILVQNLSLFVASGNQANFQRKLCLFVIIKVLNNAFQPNSQMNNL